MITGEIKNRIDQIWDTFWRGQEQLSLVGSESDKGKCGNNTLAFR